MPVPVTLHDGSIWEKELPFFAVTSYLILLMDHDWKSNESLITPSLGIDNKSRKAQENELNLHPRQISEYRKSNKGLTMELLCSLLLSQIGSPRFVTSNCEIRRKGLPHRYAPPGYMDINACYPPSNGTAAFGLIAEVSAKRQVTKPFYKKQLSQSLKYALKIWQRRKPPVVPICLPTRS